MSSVGERSARSNSWRESSVRGKVGLGEDGSGEGREEREREALDNYEVKLCLLQLLSTPLHPPFSFPSFLRQYASYSVDSESGSPVRPANLARRLAMAAQPLCAFLSIMSQPRLN